VSEADIWLSFVLITLATVATRSGLLLAGRRLVIPPRVESALRYAPACALAAIIAPDLLVAGGQLQLGIDNPRWLAGVAGIAIFALTRSTIGTIFGGMAAFWLLKFGLPF
jgi:branched-subunit amino acid transport protein